jgi:hypothetical protein
MIKAQELTKRRGGRAVVSDVTFRCEPGTVTRGRRPLGSLRTPGRAVEISRRAAEPRADRTYGPSCSHGAGSLHDERLPCGPQSE